MLYEVITVFLTDPQVLAELTATTRAGIHSYSFTNTDSAGIILDMNAGIYNYPGKTIWSSIRVENDTLITGYRHRITSYNVCYTKLLRHSMRITNLPVSCRRFMRNNFV